MADTTTANIGLLIADLNDTFNFGAHVEANFTTIDGLMGAVQCTSTSRPTNTYAGQIIYETDSKRYAQNTGTKATPTWTYMSHAAFAAASSARPTVGLTAGMLLYETDNAQVRSRGTSAWNGTLAVATSTALPANPIQGDLAYLSDKDALVRYTGSAWRLTGIVTCTSGTRPTLSLAAGTTIYETDTTRLLVYNGTSWEQKAFASFVCTSSTHPANPFTGLQIFETDTNLFGVYGGSSYLYPAQKIGSVILTGSQASMSVANIPAVFNHLIAFCTLRQDSGSGGAFSFVRFNSDSANNYTWQGVLGNVSTASSSNSGGLVGGIRFGVAAGSGDTANYFGSGSFEVGNIQSAVYKPLSGHFQGPVGSANGYAGTYGGLWQSTATVTSVSVFPSSGNLVAGSSLSLYGIM